MPHSGTKGGGHPEKKSRGLDDPTLVNEGGEAAGEKRDCNHQKRHEKEGWKDN